MSASSSSNFRARRAGTQSLTHSLCEVCLRRSVAWQNVAGYEIRLCRHCDHNTVAISIDADEFVDETYCDSYFTGGGAGYEDYIRESRYLRHQGRRYARLLRKYGVERVLDIGAAAGFFVAGLADEGVSGVGLEPNAGMVEMGRLRGLDIRAGTAEGMRRDEQFDAVLMVQVIAHFFDLHRALGNAAAVTRARGFWLVETWDRGSWTARLLGKGWHEYSPPSVLRMFSVGSLRKVAAAYGFELVAKGRPRKVITVAHAHSLLEYKARDSNVMRVLAFLTRLLPQGAALPYPFDDVRWLLFRKR